MCTLCCSWCINSDTILNLLRHVRVSNYRFVKALSWQETDWLGQETTDLAYNRSRWQDAGTQDSQLSWLFTDTIGSSDKRNPFVKHRTKDTLPTLEKF